MVSLSEFAVGCFQSIGTYVLLRGADELTELKHGQDLDILVADLEIAEEGIRTEFEKSMADDFDLEISWPKNRVHIDLVSNGEIVLRFDLVQDFSFFSRLSIRPSFKIDLMIRRKVTRVHGMPVFLPSTLDDLIMRYFEFMEYFDTRPDKVKHLDYIVAKLEEVSGEGFFDATHHYIGFPVESWNGAVQEDRGSKSVRGASRDVIRAIMTLGSCVRRSAVSRTRDWIRRLGSQSPQDL